LFLQHKYFENPSGDTSEFTGLHKLRPDKVETELCCVPVYTLLLALNRTVVDLFSLDIEGAELDVLQTMPFDEIKFKVLMVETAWTPGGNVAERMKSFLSMQEYVFYKTVTMDSIFVHEDYLVDFKEYL
jgi:hypothetical protein